MSADVPARLLAKGILRNPRRVRPEHHERISTCRGREGLDAAQVIRQQLPNTGILVLSAYAKVEHAMELH